MSKCIALGLLGAGAILLAILLTGCSDAPSPTPSAGAVSQSHRYGTARSHTGADAYAHAWLRQTPPQPEPYRRPPWRRHARPQPHAIPTATMAPTHTPTATPIPTATPTPTMAPTHTPTATPTPTPTMAPTNRRPQPHLRLRPPWRRHTRPQPHLHLRPPWRRHRRPQPHLHLRPPWRRHTRPQPQPTPTPTMAPTHTPTATPTPTPHHGADTHAHSHTHCDAHTHADTHAHSHSLQPTATPTPTPTPTLAGPPITPLGLVPPVPGSCGDGTHDTPVPVTGLLGGNKSPSWRSDCAEIAYVQNLGVSVMKRDGEHLRDLYLYEPGSSVAGAVSWTAWSPDGTRLALAVENSGSGDPYWARHIWVVEADGSNMVQLTSGPDWDNSPAWSPDGNRIVFQRVISHFSRQIVTIDVDGSNETQLTADSTEKYVPSWSPDGANIGYVTDGQLALMAPDGSNKRVIVASHAVGGLLGGMSWSPDSSQIAYTRDLGECIGIVLINADGTDERRINYPPGDSRQPAWSPDGELLLFVNTIARGTGQIYIVSVHGGSRDGLEEGCSQVERYEPSQDVAAPYDWQSRLPQEAAPASALECRPPDPRGGVSAGFPRPPWVPSVGKLRIAMLFVDFPDAVADYSTRVEVEHFDTTFGYQGTSPWHQKSCCD